MSAKFDWRAQEKARIASGNIVPMKSSPRDELGVIDPRDQFGNAPPYIMGQGMLPKVYEDYAQDNIAEYGGDPAAYACAFLAMHCGVLHSTVEMQTRPRMSGNWRNPNEHSLTLGKTGANKSGLFKDLTKHQERWQAALFAAAPVKRGKASLPPMMILQSGSIEGVLRQVSDNRGERIILANDEAMNFFMGTGAHHQGNANSMMTDLVCKLYDGEPYTKSLVKTSYTIPKALGTLIMATVFEKFSGWEAFPKMIESGMLARTTVGIISQPQKRNIRKSIEGADKAMGDALFRLRALRDTRFALSPEAAQGWTEFIDHKEDANLALEAERTSPGLTAWVKKYDTRIISMATVLQAYDFTASTQSQQDYEPFDIPKTAQDDDKVGGGEVRQGKLVRITLANLERAITFVEGFLMDTQRYFYEMAEGTTEFGPELYNWMAHRISIDDPDYPEGRIISRNELTFSGPTVVRPGRGGITPAVKEKQLRWVQALIDYGFIEVYEHPKQRRMLKTRRDTEMPWYKARDEFFLKFSDDATRAQFRRDDEALQARILANTTGRVPLTLKRIRDLKEPPIGDVLPMKKAPDEGG